MAQGEPKRRTTAGRDWLVIALLALALVLLIVFLVWLWQQPKPQPVPLAPGVEKDLIYGGMPRATGPEPPLTVLRNIGYVAGYSEQRKDPLWVAYKLFKVDNPLTYPRPQRFTVDPRTTARLDESVYRNSGYDKGHMAPNHAIAQCYGKQAQLETFLLSNVCPQLHALNAGAWERLEKEELDRYANRYGTVWIFDGPLFDAQPRELPGGIQIPRAFYKIVIQEQNGQPRMLAFIMPQQARSGDHPEQYLTSVEEVEKESGFDFFWQLGKEAEERLEKTKAQGMW